MENEMNMFSKPTDYTDADRAEDWAFGMLILGLLVTGIGILTSAYEVLEYCTPLLVFPV